MGQPGVCGGSGRLGAAARLSARPRRVWEVIYKLQQQWGERIWRGVRRLRAKALTRCGLAGSCCLSEIWLPASCY